MRSRSFVKPTGRRFADSGHPVELEVLLTEEELLHACAHCEKWEMPGHRRWPVCSGCEERFYCSLEVSDACLPLC